MNKFTSARALILATALLLSACQPDSGQPNLSEAPLAGAKMGGAFALTNQDGKLVTERDFAGQFRIVYFGYTFCPDVCPVDAQAIGQAVKLFEKADKVRAAKLTAIFITGDPARDTPAALKEFLGNFHPRFVGLTGSEADVDAVVRAYGAIVTRQKPNAQGGYLVDHSRNAVLFGPQGQPLVILPQGEGPKAIADELARWVR
jgi:protein SCO1